MIQTKINHLRQRLGEKLMHLAFRLMPYRTFDYYSSLWSNAIVRDSLARDGWLNHSYTPQVWPVPRVRPVHPPLPPELQPDPEVKPDKTRIRR